MGSQYNKIAKIEPGVIIELASFQLNERIHGNKHTKIDKADGMAVTLPPATGTGNTYAVVVGTAITSNSTTIKAASASDSFAGTAFGVDTDAEGATGYTWNADSGDDTFTMDGAARGGEIGDVILFTDLASGLWLVDARITQSGGSEATPFSATVS